MARPRVLVVTGTLAKGLVESCVRGAPVDAQVLALPRPVAALMSCSFIAKELKRRGVRGFDLILVPGMAMGDARLIEEGVGIRAAKGPRHAADLPVVLEAVAEGAELSTKDPACELLRRRVEERVAALLRELEGRVSRAGAVKVGRRRGVWVGGPVLRVFAEVLDAPLLSREELVRAARRYREAGADVVDLGMLSEDPRPRAVRGLVRAVRRAVGPPVSVDTLDWGEVVEALKAKADAVLSLTPSVAERAERLLDIEGAREAAYVVVPFEPRGRRRAGAEERVEVLLEAVGRLRRAGLRRVIADPLLDPPVAPGCLEGLRACQLLKAKAPDVPIMLGVGNVTELIDADSHGVNALLVSLAAEAGASAILTTEGSSKTRGCVEEAVRAAKMASLAKARGAPPKDLGVDLLVVKEKRRRGVRVELPPKVVEASGVEEPRRDPAGSFRIGVDEEGGLLVAVHYPPGSATPDLAVVARRALEARDAIVKLGLVSDLRHAFYLGYELAKAEVALRLRRSYVQDEDVV
ncbi:MAG: dihydropteroate synthase-like protein [Candidatus Nezhaarchaeales archaeon]